MCTDAIFFSTHGYLATLDVNNHIDKQVQRVRETDKNGNGYKDEDQKA